MATTRYRWIGTLGFVNRMTDDNRVLLKPRELRHRDLPLPLTDSTIDGVPVVVGAITMLRLAGDTVDAAGHIDVDDEEERTAALLRGEPVPTGINVIHDHPADIVTTPNGLIRVTAEWTAIGACINMTASWLGAAIRITQRDNL